MPKPAEDETSCDGYDETHVIEKRTRGAKSTAKEKPATRKAAI